MLMRKCMNPDCRGEFRPLHSGHIWCSEGCHYAILVAEIGKSAAGMRPLGFLGDGEKIKAFNRKWARKAKVAA